MIGLDKIDHVRPNGHPIKIVVMDSGIDFSENVNVVERINFVEDENDIPPYFQDVTSHGTSIAGVISEINPDAEIYSIRVLDKNNQAVLSSIMNGIQWCIDNRVQLINMSFGTSTYSAALEEMVKRAEEAGILMIGAAGNGGSKKGVEYPAAFDEVMAIGAVDTDATKTAESAVGEAIELVAPGEQILTNGAFGGKVVVGGTSLSVSHIAGVASLLWQKDLDKNSMFIRRLLSESAENIEGQESYYGNGLVDVSYALSQYDEFEKNYTSNKSETAEITPHNMDIPEAFDNVDYIEGRWGSTNHQAVPGQWEAQNLGSIQLGQIKAMKSYCVVPDNESYRAWFKEA